MDVPFTLDGDMGGSAPLLIDVTPVGDDVETPPSNDATVAKVDLGIAG